MRLLGDYEPYFHCACAETARMLLPASNLTMPFDPACLKTYMSEKLWLKTLFKGHFEACLHCACAETARILLPVSDLTTPFDPAWSKTYIMAKNAILGDFETNFHCACA